MTKPQTFPSILRDGERVFCFDDDEYPYRSRKPEAFTQPFCDFLAACPTVFHAVDHLTTKLRAFDFVELPPRDDWAGRIEPGGRYYVSRNGSSLVAFTIGASYQPGNGFAIVGSHLDALTARLRPMSTRPSRAGYLQLGVAPYAGGLNNTWWDRDLSVGGRVVLRDPKSGSTHTALVKLDWPIARIPTLAPHFGFPTMGSGNQETELVPIIGLGTDENMDDSRCSYCRCGDSFIDAQPPGLVKLIRDYLALEEDNKTKKIVNWELELYDCQAAQTGGMNHEFIFGGRLDDKLCSWAALVGLLAADKSPDDSIVQMVALFDDEEVGSLVRQGAGSNFLPSVIERVVEASCHSASDDGPRDNGAGAAHYCETKTHPTPAVAAPRFGPGLMGRTFARSFLVSADVTHAAHPNFPRCNVEGHAPRLNVGVALMTDASGHSATDARSDDVARRVAELAGLAPPQRSQAPNDTRHGSTIGPVLAAALGIRTADLGLPQLSMHSIRATTGALDPGFGVLFFRAFLEHWQQIDQEWHH